MATAIMILAFLVFALGALAPQFADDESVRPEQPEPKTGIDK